MLFNDIYVGTPFGQGYGDLVEIIEVESSVADKDIDLTSRIGLSVESPLRSRIDLDGPVFDSLPD